MEKRIQIDDMRGILRQRVSKGASRILLARLGLFVVLPLIFGMRKDTRDSDRRIIRFFRMKRRPVSATHVTPGKRADP
ncbi:hypothetical protein LGM65_15340 [Burkholderia anthina]|uniref:hypothetical protein n=1 Tax=Burkholderia anthina TaxID=179879 RepID=UPI001CF13754|nr:hypothetical protein [Burkholderia anthina]MCA8092249.1 hypothetical protein [Burkholderia anthina]